MNCTPSIMAGRWVMCTSLRPPPGNGERWLPFTTLPEVPGGNGSASGWAKPLSASGTGSVPKMAATPTQGAGMEGRGPQRRRHPPVAVSQRDGWAIAAGNGQSRRLEAHYYVSKPVGRASAAGNGQARKPGGGLHFLQPSLRSAAAATGATSGICSDWIWTITG